MVSPDELRLLRSRVEERERGMNPRHLRREGREVTSRTRRPRLLRALIPAQFIGFRTTEVAAVSSFRCSSRDYAAARTQHDGLPVWNTR